MEKNSATSSGVEHAHDGLEKGFMPPQKNLDGEVKLLSDLSEIRLIPIPTDDPNDPLTWSAWRKAGVVGTCCWFGMYFGQDPAGLQL